MKVNDYEAANWKLRDAKLSVNEIQFAIKDGLPSSMKDELDDNKEEYSPLKGDVY